MTTSMKTKQNRHQQQFLKFLRPESHILLGIFTNL